MLTIQCAPNLHPALISVARALRATLETNGLATATPTTYIDDTATGGLIQIGRLGQDLGMAPPDGADRLGTDGYAWSIERDFAGRPRAAIWGQNDRGVQFGVHDLIERIKLVHGWPESSSGTRSPVLPVRRWSGAISRLHRRPWHDTRSLADGLARMRRFIDLAPAYGVSSFEINGRPGDGFDPDWLLAYRDAPEFAPLRSVETSDDHLRLLEATARYANHRLIDLYIWSHELYVPPEFFVVFPETRGVDYSLCTSHPRVHRWIRARYAELFDGAPSLAGIVLSVNESGHFSLISDQGCQCDQCGPMSRSERLLKVLESVIAVCQQYGKKVVLRTFQAAVFNDLDSHPDLEIIREAFSKVPVEVDLMSKYCPQDFYGTTIVDEPLIGAFANPHLVEYSLDREWSGRTYSPALTPVDFQTRLRRNIKRGIAGTVTRVDFPFPQMEPDELFTHPNDFNAYVFGKLNWDPDYDLERAWTDWGQLRYGPAAAPAVIAALKRTELASERIFFVHGVPCVNYHNMIAPPEHAVGFIWAKAPSKWESDKRWITDRLLRPDEAFIHEVSATPLVARDEMQQAIAELAAARDHVDPNDFVKLRDQLAVIGDSGVLWSHLNELFFRQRAWDDRSKSPDPPKTPIAELPAPAELARSLAAANAVVRQALAMEQRHGPYSWPVFSPDRGVSAYEFVELVWIGYLSTFVGRLIPGPGGTRWGSSFTHSWSRRGPGFQRDDYLGLWLDCFAAARSHWGWQSPPRPVGLTDGLASLRFAADTLELVDPRGRTFPLPVGLPITGDPIEAGSAATISIRRTPTGLEMDRGS